MVQNFEHVVAIFSLLLKLGFQWIIDFKLIHTTTMARSNLGRDQHQGKAIRNIIFQPGITDQFKPRTRILV